jgi:hypothetical protein
VPDGHHRAAAFKVAAGGHEIVFVSGHRFSGRHYFFSLAAEELCIDLSRRCLGSKGGGAEQNGYGKCGEREFHVHSQPSSGGFSRRSLAGSGDCVPVE